MRRTVVAIPLAALALVAWLAPQTFAQDTKTTGTVAAMAASSITITSGGKSMTFTVEPTTDVIVRGGGTASRAAARAGKPGPSLAELIKVGDSVEVTSHQKGAALLASIIRKVDAPAASSGAAPEAKAASSNGTVETVSGTSLTITGAASGGGTFKQTFTIDNTTKVIAVGAGTAAAARGGKIVVTDIVARGDRVSVSYHPMGEALHAAEIRVTAKASK